MRRQLSQSSNILRIDSSVTGVGVLLVAINLVLHSLWHCFVDSLRWLLMLLVDVKCFSYVTIFIAPHPVNPLLVLTENWESLLMIQ